MCFKDEKSFKNSKFDLKSFIDISNVSKSPQMSVKSLGVLEHSLGIDSDEDLKSSGFIDDIEEIRKLNFFKSFNLIDSSFEEFLTDKINFEI